MKTKIRSFLIIIAFFATSFTFADDKLNSSAESHHSVNIGYPMEIPKALTLRLDVQITLFLVDFFNLSWEPENLKQDYFADSQKKN